MAHYKSINIFSFNCHGFNSCFDDIINELLTTSDIAFICEHWLQPYEIPGVQRLLLNEGLKCHLKSSINPEEVLTGRPYGGVGFIYRKSPDLSYRITETDSDRISAMQILNKTDGKILLNLFGVYLPHYNGEPEQIATYSECLDQLQALIDNCHDSPIIVLGDLNAAIPRQQNLQHNWYRRRPYTHHSQILYDFIINNDLNVANYLFDQPINHTFENGDSSSYIDHVLVSQHATASIRKCEICSNDVDWHSDHLPLRTNFEISVQTNKGRSPHDTSRSIPKFRRPKWEKTQVQKTYSESLKSFLSESSFPPLVSTNRAEAQSSIDSMYDRLVEAMHNAGSSASDSERPASNNYQRRQPWWSEDCKIARDRTRFWRQLWVINGRDRTTQVFQIYKYNKKIYRNARRNAVRTFHKDNFTKLSNIFNSGNSRSFWNKVRKLKVPKDAVTDEIDTPSLKNFFQDKFKKSVGNNTVSEYEANVQRIFSMLKDKIYGNSFFNKDSIVKYILKLKKGRAPGMDGITPEHLRYAVNNTILPELLSSLFNICLKFGILPKAFQTSILIPIIKKPTLNPAEPNNYRPVMLSSIISKVLEYAILDNTNHSFSDSQYGFVSGRDTKMAIASTVDVITYCNTRGSAVYACTLDAEKAFDAIPHCVLLSKVYNVIHDNFWRLLYTWYSNSNAVIRWNNRMSEPFKLARGTRQGGLTSPFMFNLIYQDVVDEINCLNGGIKIGNTSFNIFCYADDLLLTSTTASGLQKLITYVNDRICNLGLSFNVQKTSCIIFGKNYLVEPSWSLNNCNIAIVNDINYLGATLCNKPDMSAVHVKTRISKCRKAFYSLQSVGMCNNGVEPKVISYLWKTAIQPILMYGAESFQQRRKNVMDMIKIQSRLVKSSLGLKKYFHSTPLLAALFIPKIDTVLNTQTLQLFNSIMGNNARAKKLYCHVLKNFSCTSPQSTLIHRAIDICRRNDTSIVKTIFDKNYVKNVCKQLKKKDCVNDGLVDSCRQLLNQYDGYNKYMLELLLTPF